jgi:hypothetical protein
MKTLQKVFPVILGATAMGLVAAIPAAEIKVVTEYRYPTSFEVTPITQTMPDGSVRVVGGITTPKDFETREVGVYMSVVADIARIAGVAAVTDGMKLLNENTDLMVAATSGDYSLARKTMAKGTSVDARNRFGSTALMGASAGGFEKIVKLLLDSGANPNVASASGSTALGFAAKNGHVPVIQMLLEKGADINAADGEGLNPLMQAVRGGYASAAKVLIDKGADVNQPDRSGSTPLMLAQARNERDLVILLTKVGNRK